MLFETQALKMLFIFSFPGSVARILIKFSIRAADMKIASCHFLAQIIAISGFEQLRGLG